MNNIYDKDSIVKNYDMLNRTYVKLTWLGKSTISNCTAKSGRNPQASRKITAELPTRLNKRALFCVKLSINGWPCQNVT